MSSSYDLWRTEIQKIRESRRMIAEIVAEFDFRLEYQSPETPKSSRGDGYSMESDEHYPCLKLYVSYSGIKITYGINSFPSDERYHRRVEELRVPNPDELRSFLEKYMQEVKDLENIPRSKFQ